MNEESKVVSVAEEDLATFDEGWGDAAETGGGEAEAELAPEAPAEETPVEEHQEADKGPEGVQEGAEGAGDRGPAPEADKPVEGAQEAQRSEQEQEETFEFTLDGQTRRVGREEAVRLAQKGADYDRVRGELDGLNRTVTELGGLENVRGFAAVLEELAHNGGMTVEQTLDSLRAGVIARRDNVGMDMARERARAERLQKTGEERRTREEAERTKRAEEERRRDADFAAFVRAYPTVQAKDIPQEVWQGVRQGQSLVTAYALYDARAARAETARLRTEAETARKNEENRAKAAPSVSTAGTAAGTQDAFEEGWDLE